MIKRTALPPMNPTAGTRWRTSGAVYVWRPGRGWVLEDLIDDQAEPVAPSVDASRLAQIVAGFAAQIREANALALTRPDPSARLRVIALMVALHLLCCHANLSALTLARMPAATEKPKLKCEKCGGPRSIWSKRFCRACHIAGITKKDPPPAPICSDCGGPRSKFAAGTRCRKCWRAAHEASKFGQEVEPVDQPQAARVAQAEEMTDAGVEMMEAAVPAVPRFLVEQPPSPKPRPVAPAPPPEPPKVSAPHERQAPHPILERHAREAPIDPLAKVRERKPAPPPAFSPEFEAKLAKVRAGAGIVEIRPISRPVDEAVGGASSLNFI